LSINVVLNDIATKARRLTWAYNDWMRRLCVLICFSLFASLIHAAVMPIAGLDNGSQHEITAPDSGAHHHEDTDAQVKTKTVNHNQCHGKTFQCCLGFVMTTQVMSSAAINNFNVFDSLSQSLMIEGFSNQIYRPPKLLG
jgi:hypothetical protein